ncbi:methyltransferase-domain-containing protein [Pseudoneurospora amorphoporcata]|uniref:Ribosomal RNA-processing protein 8 n=1 Tax=Pseudoneurospora amorphoporcata TaxID=241081 RepID=A0AAN6P4B0_9PEZI|nr:methyltransferase-domain-containing protein [Pseudoneurospora amorphoporcata]
MFAVKGLNVSTDKLKVETEHGSVLATPMPRTVAAGEEGAAPKPKPKKRKRAGRSNHTDVNLENVADLWEKVIEGGDNKARKAREDAKKEAHKAKKQKTEATENQPEGTTAAAEAAEAATLKPATTLKDKKKKIKADKKAAADATTTESKPSAPTPAPAPAAPKLTPLQAAMREKLISARFRHLNETLYTRPSKEAFSLFSDSPEMFTEYHEGFRRQVDVWPENPVNGYIADIKTRGKLRNAPRTRPGDGTSEGTKYPLPRDRNGLCTIADLGCGDAKLAEALVPLKRKLGIEVKSYDLQDGGKPELITRADIANLPLKEGSVDVAIFCLALMGTNWIDFVEEAYRVLRWKGELWVAEIKSRFVDPTKQGGKKGGPGNVVSHSVGNRRKPGAASGGPVGKKDKAKMKEEEEAEEEQQLAVHVDGVELRKQETDVTAFVEALRKRGFLLQREYGHGAVDMDNKMFVKMHFVKAVPAIKGKCADLKKEALKTTQTDAKGRPIKTPKFIDAADGEASFNENALLKPCVYKIR